MHILDSSAIIEILYGSAIGKKIEEKIKDDPVATTSFSVFEVLIGEAPRNMEKTFSFLRTMEILPFDSEAARHSLEIEKELSKKGRKANIVDVFILGVCKQYSLALITLDKGMKNTSLVHVEVVE